MKKSEQALLPRIYRTDSFDVAYAEYLAAKPISINGKVATPSNIISEKKYTIKDTDSTYRTINHWAKLGLIDDERKEEGKGWRKFSIVDLVWVAVLKQLRGYGFSLDKIKKGYETLKASPSLFEFGIYLAMARQAVYLIIFNDGYIEVATRNTLNISESLGSLTEISYLVINLNNCLVQLLSNSNFTPKFNEYSLSEKELSILADLRYGGYEEIKVQMYNGEIHRIDAKSKDMGEITKLSDVLNTIQHGEFTIKKQGGKIVYTEKIEKRKV